MSDKKKRVESQLDCKATAELNNQIVDDLEKEDGSLEELLKDDPEDAPE